MCLVSLLQTLEILNRPGAYEHLERVTKKLVDGLLAAGREAGHEMCGSNISGMFGFFFCKGPVRSFEEALAADTKKFARFHRAMLEEGVYLAPSQVRQALLYGSTHAAYAC